jgi:hypothetical protein
MSVWHARTQIPRDANPRNKMLRFRQHAHGSAGTQCAVGHGYISTLSASRMSVCAYMCLRACMCVSVRTHIGVFVFSSCFSWTEASNVPVWAGDLTDLRQPCMSDCVCMCLRVCMCVRVSAHIGVFVLRTRFSWTEG